MRFPQIRREYLWAKTEPCVPPPPILPVAPEHSINPPPEIWKEICDFSMRETQELRRHYQRLFPEGWRQEDACFEQWYVLAGFQPPRLHGSIYTRAEIRGLDAAIPHFTRWMDDVKSGAVPAPDWVKKIPPPPPDRGLGARLPHGG